jgi:N-acetylglucosaminyldiphosphoundecaprenol N-acetyl-beta-D-mannosaminyltransferase
MEPESARAARTFDRKVYCLLGLPVDAVTAQDGISRLFDAVHTRNQCVWSTPNVNNLVACQIDPNFRDTLLRSNLSTIDGMPLVIIARMIGIPIPERVAGSNVFELLMRGAAGPISVYFFGGQDGIAKQASERLSTISSSMRCVGYHSPGFGPIEGLCTEEIVAAITQASPDFLVLALGTQRGHEWIKRTSERLSVPVVTHLGSVVNFVAGTVRRAPRWLQRLGLEWLWRIGEEPYLARRYVSDAIVLLRLTFTHILPATIHRILFAPKETDLGRARLVTEEDGRTRIVRLQGPWTARNIDPLRQVFAEVTFQGYDLLLDLSLLSYVDTAVIGLVLLARGVQSKNNKIFKIVSVNSRIRRILSMHCSKYILE